MPDILKITSPVGVKNKIQNTPKNKPTDALFDLGSSKKVSSQSNSKNRVEADGAANALIRDLNRVICKPLTNNTMVQSECMRKLILYAKLYEVSSGIISEDFIENLFVKPEDLHSELMKREEAATLFKGEFFETLRLLVKYPGQQKLHEAIISILKYFDCYVNHDNTLEAILKTSDLLTLQLSKEDAQILKEQSERLKLIIENEDDYKETVKFIKNDFMPVIKRLAADIGHNDKVHNLITSIIHYIVRYDKADIALLEEAVFRLGSELKPLTRLTDDDIADMKDQLLKSAKDIMRSGHIKETENADIAALLAKGLDKNGPVKINNIAQNLLLYILQSESPVMNLMHFMIPVRFMDENTYGEFFIDKDCFGRRGDAKETKNIFFTIQSDIYGTFEVDLLAKDRDIELDIKCPDSLVNALQDIKQRIKDIIAGQGYRLLYYRVEEYRESKSVLARFPKLSLRKVGIDVKI